MLDLCAVLKRSRGIWRILECCWHGMLVLLECLVNIPRHGAAYMALFVVPREFYATEEQSRPVNGNLVVFLE